MKRKISALLGIVIINYFINLFAGSVMSDGGLFTNDMSYTFAKDPDIQYLYDSLGRVTTVQYPNGMVMKYKYDANGNIVACEKVEASSTGGGQPGNSQAGDSQQNGGSTGNNNGGGSTQKPPVVSNPLRYTATDIKNYNKFKKRKPVIKSLKKSKSKKKYYLKIQIKQINKRGTYGESGYQIKYATNKKFKKAKTIKIIRNKKSSVTSKKWKVKKGKTYYVKVRASMKTKTGKTIYSKYSKTKKIKIK